jgi:hypothetical protein
MHVVCHIGGAAEESRPVSGNDEPVLDALLLRVTIAGYEQIPNRRRLVAAAVVAVVAIASFGLGKINSRFLTCNDFVISGNDTPPSCTHGGGHLRNG